MKLRNTETSAEVGIAVWESFQMFSHTCTDCTRRPLHTVQDPEVLHFSASSYSAFVRTSFPCGIQNHRFLPCPRIMLVELEAERRVVA